MQNECAIGTHDCAPDGGICEDTPDSFTCRYALCLEYYMYLVYCLVCYLYLVYDKGYILNACLTCSFCFVYFFGLCSYSLTM